MNRSELIQRLAGRFPQLLPKDASLATAEILAAIAAALAMRKRVEIRGFGSFSLNYRPPRQARNPKTGEPLQLAARLVPHFKAGKELRERIDQSAPAPAGQ